MLTTEFRRRSEGHGAVTEMGEDTTRMHRVWGCVRGARVVLVEGGLAWAAGGLHRVKMREEGEMEGAAWESCRGEMDDGNGEDGVRSLRGDGHGRGRASRFTEDEDEGKMKAAHACGNG